MNASSNGHIEPAADISALILMAVSGCGQWQQVLEAVMAATGASAGVISLRAHVHAGHFFPESAPLELTAPLIVGIPPEHVASYFEHYSTIDPWTGIQYAHYPDAPYFMSEHLCLDDLQKSEFYAGWLQPQRISECLVAEIYRSKRYWVAVNLLFDHAAFARHEVILAQMAVVLPVMRTGWELSERLLALTTSQAASRGYLENWPYPCVILDQDLVVTSANTLGLSEFPRHLTLSVPLDVGAMLELDGGPVSGILEHLRRTAGVTGAASKVLKAPSDRKGYVLEISPVVQETDVLGRRRAHYVVLAKPEAAPSTADAPTPRIWEADALTPAQAAMVKWIAEGGHATEFAMLNGITKKTAYDHLAAARQKLGGISARDIYTSHQALLMMERRDGGATR